MSKRDIGVVIKFNEGTCNDYGFIESFSGVEDIFFHRSFLISGVPRRGDLVSFEPIHSAKGWRGEKVSVLNAQSLATEIDFSDAETYEKIRKGILYKKGYRFLKDVIAAIPEENFFKYSWLRKDLDSRERIELFLKRFREEPSSELEEEISTAIKNFDGIKFALPSELAIKEKFWIHGDKASKIAALKKFATILSAEELFKIICKPDEELSIEETATILQESLDKEKFSELLMKFASQNQNFNALAKLILENNLPNEAILTHWYKLDDENKLVALEKYFDELTNEKVAELSKNLSPEEIFPLIRDKETFAEKVSAIVESCASQSQNFNGWAKFILENNLPNEAILTHWYKLDDGNKLVALEKYFDELTTEKVAELSKNLSPEEIFPLVKDKKTFAEKVSSIINTSYRKNEWAKCLTDDIELFKAADLCDDVIIFFVYEFVKRKYNLNELTNALLAKKETIKSSVRLQVICRYVWAAYKKSCGNIHASDKAKADAEEALAAIFNEIAQKLEEITEHGAEFEFTEHKAHILPPCTEIGIRNCYFCEAVTWPQKATDEDGKPILKDGKPVWIFGRNYCPRLNRSDKSCFRIKPNLELPSEKWSVVELTKALGLMQYETQWELEFFMRIGGEFNRIYDLKESLKCRKCGKYMRSTRGTWWKKVLNLRDLTWKQHFAIFNATTFSCQNENCSEHGQEVYMSYCWHCGGRIDSRDNRVRIKGFYSCLHCGAGYRDVVGITKYALFPGEVCPLCTKCPSCGGQEFALLKRGNKFSLECKKCSKTFVPKNTLQTDNRRNFYCENEECNEQLKVMPEVLKREVERLDLEEIPWYI